MSKRKTGCDFSQVEALAKRLEKAACGDERKSTLKPNQIMRVGMAKQTEWLVNKTPLGRDGSNWYGWYYPPGGGDLGGKHSASYLTVGRDQRAGTLKRGWVQDSPEFKWGTPSVDEIKNRVNTLPIERVGTRRTMTIYNSAPYAWAIEVGHLVRMPYFFSTPPTKPRQGVITGRIPGKWYTMEAVHEAESDVQNAMAKELHKQLDKVVRGQ